MKKTNKRGISLIVLVITIIVMIILASAIILSLSNSGIIGRANEASFKTDVKSIQEELTIELADAILEDRADALEGVAAETVLDSAQKYPEKFVISNQKLMYIGEKVTADERAYLDQIGIEELWDNSQAYLFEIDENGVLTGVKGEYLIDGSSACVYVDGAEVTELVLPKGITAIGSEAFIRCSITSITIPNGVTSIGDLAFYNCVALTTITLPDSVTSIGDNAFGNCSRLTTITLPDSVTSIGSSAFYQSGLASITIPDSVTSIGDSTFYGCMLTSIEIPNGVTSIGMEAFSRCEYLTTITLPDSVTSIGERAFVGCGLTSITIPTGITAIPCAAFGGVPLTDVYYKGTQAQWEAITIDNTYEGNACFSTAIIHYNS